MALEIRKAEAATVGIVADRRLYLTPDKSRVVEDGDPGAAFLFTTPGVVIPAAEAAALHLSIVDGKVVQGATEPKVEESVGIPAPPVVPALPKDNTVMTQKPVKAKK